MKALLLLLLAICSICSAATAENSAEPGELRFRRVYVPETTKDWLKGNVKYLPMEAGEFERLLETIQRTTRGAGADFRGHR